MIDNVIYLCLVSSHEKQKRSAVLIKIVEPDKFLVRVKNLPNGAYLEWEDYTLTELKNAFRDVQGRGLVIRSPKKEWMP